MNGKVHLYARSNINTDEIIPARHLNVHDETTLATHAMEDIDPDFVKNVNAGDFIVAGEDFGCGSSREHAVWALRGAGIKAVLADSFSRIFFRNAINNGFYAIEISGISGKVKPGDELQITPDQGLVKNLTNSEEYTFSPYTDYFKDVIDAGGLMNYLANRN
ncbi:3-isopropylmalate dehydratase small subunit [Candidatus Neomarinimicrobiota bacterium]